MYRDRLHVYKSPYSLITSNLHLDLDTISKHISGQCDSTICIIGEYSFTEMFQLITFTDSIFYTGLLRYIRYLFIRLQILITNCVTDDGSVYLVIDSGWREELLYPSRIP